MKGFPSRKLNYMRAFAEAWPKAELLQEVLAQLPWYQQIALLDHDEMRNLLADERHTGPRIRNVATQMRELLYATCPVAGIAAEASPSTHGAET
jgi:hypothetical protein